MIPPNYLVGTAAVAGNLLKKKWSIAILRHLDSGLTDPAEICKVEMDLTPMALTERLRTMLRYSLVTRYPRHGAKKIVEYRLTPRGRKILNMLTLIEQLDELSDLTLIESLNEESLPKSPGSGELKAKPRPPNKDRGKKAG